ncbi:copper chaperone PCu(A)C [Sansalvadorimonas verongulae]|uniref:copper chaperone PCu(A)C n=1 Tax=Sansalvadorimonas verongulae TaxID=2172824 RepID=UPI0012BCF681|nr:copper chaperone PCu(A)C [Sansalvadorimonas verongulae]MTI15579.1 copper chaperone PCu(A)C [Sansalvadorimonas verongulae]
MIKKWLSGVYLPFMAFAYVIILAGGANAAPVDNILVTEPRVRAMPPGSPNTAAYLTIKNLGRTDIALEKVVSPISHHTMLHDTVKKDGKMSMVHQMSITIPAGKRVKFKPGGLHIMVMGLSKSLTIGDMVPFELHFSNGTVLNIKAAVKKQVSEKGNLSG